MTFIVEVFRVPANGNIDFSIHFKVWERLLKIAEQEGWKPAGTLQPAGSKLTPFTSDYEPDYDDSKVVTKEDALNLSRALESILAKMRNGEYSPKQEGPVILKEDTINNEVMISEPNITEDLLTKLITYLKQGEFHFWWDE